jgi:hypothetical protein
MSGRRGGVLLVCSVILVGACSSSAAQEAPTVVSPVPSTARPATTSTTVVRTNPSTTSTTSAPRTTASVAATTVAATTIPATTVPVTTTTPATTVAPTTVAPTTTVPAPPALDVADPACVVQVAPDQTLTMITDLIPDEIVVPETVEAENGLPDDVLQPGQLLDVCVGNGLNDITGEQRTEPNAAVESVATRLNVEKQQNKLNELFAGYGINQLLVDGISGPVTRQRLCAFRLSLGFPATTHDMAAGSDEEIWLMALTALPVPPSAPSDAERWILIDRSCQIMFVGAGQQLAFVFPTSTGTAEFPTRTQDRSRAFRYDPAANNGGWHDSLTYPADEDNPLNGNMYKPLYFDRGQAIHGALNVPTSPASHGCARLRVEHQDLLIGWLGLGDADRAFNDSGRINAIVRVQGEYGWA